MAYGADHARRPLRLATGSTSDSNGSDPQFCQRVARRRASQREGLPPTLNGPRSQNTVLGGQQRRKRLVLSSAPNAHPDRCRQVPPHVRSRQHTRNIPAAQPTRIIDRRSAAPQPSAQSATHQRRNQLEWLVARSAPRPQASAQSATHQRRNQLESLVARPAPRPQPSAHPAPVFTPALHALAQKPHRLPPPAVGRGYHAAQVWL
jgi:hypothetical protein